MLSGSGKSGHPYLVPGSFLFFIIWHDVCSNHYGKQLQALKNQK